MRLNVDVGDKVIRFLAPSRDNRWKAEIHLGTVVAIDDNVITGSFLVDQNREIKYHRKTGLNLNNIGFVSDIDDMDFIIPVTEIRTILEPLLHKS